MEKLLYTQQHDFKRGIWFDRKRCTPSTPRAQACSTPGVSFKGCVRQPNAVLSRTLVSRSGPMNISYKRRESAPKSATTSSGLITLPLGVVVHHAGY